MMHTLYTRGSLNEQKTFLLYGNWYICQVGLFAVRYSSAELAVLFLNLEVLMMGLFDRLGKRGTKKAPEDRLPVRRNALEVGTDKDVSQFPLFVTVEGPPAQTGLTPGSRRYIRRRRLESSRAGKDVKMLTKLARRDKRKERRNKKKKP